MIRVVSQVFQDFSSDSVNFKETIKVLAKLIPDSTWALYANGHVLDSNTFSARVILH